MLGTEEDLWPPNFYKIGSDLRAPKAFRHEGATPAPTTPLLKPQYFPAEPECEGSWKGKKPEKRESGSLASPRGALQRAGNVWSSSCWEQGGEEGAGEGKNEQGSKEGAGEAMSLLPPPSCMPRAVLLLQVLPVLPAESGQLPALPSKANPAWAAPGMGWQLLGQLGRRAGLAGSAFPGDAGWWNPKT